MSPHTGAWITSCKSSFSGYQELFRSFHTFKNCMPSVESEQRLETEGEIEIKLTEEENVACKRQQKIEKGKQAAKRT